MRRAAAAITQGHQKDALMGLRFIWPEVKMIGKFVTDHFPPANSSVGTDSIQVVGRRVEELKIIRTLKKG